MKDYLLIITIHADPAMPPGYDEWGGTHTYMRELLEGLQQRNIPCVLVTRKTFPELPAKESLSENCIIYRITCGEQAPIDKKLLRNFHTNNKEKIKDIICEQGNNPALIHSVYWNSGELGMELSEEFNIHFVHSVISNGRGRISRGAIELSSEREFVEQAVFEHAQLILTVSKDEKNDLIKFYHIPEEKVFIAGQFIHDSFLYPAHDEGGFPRLYTRISEADKKQIELDFNMARNLDKITLWWQRKAFLYIGRIHINKGIDFIIKSWHALYQRYQEVCPPLWLAGGSISEIEQMREYITIEIPDLVELENQSKIVWWGYIDENGLSTLLLKSMVLLTHSLYEPGGRVIVEALCEGVPVIATPNGFAADYVKDFENGFLVDYGDYVTLTKRMELFLRQPFLSGYLGQTARQTGRMVLAEWSFLDTHCLSYRLAGLPTKTHKSPSSSVEYQFRKRYINAYPFLQKEVPIETLWELSAQLLNESIVDIKPYNQHEDNSSDVWEIFTTKDHYIIKHLYTKFSLEALYHPFFRDVYTHTASFRFRSNLKGLQILNPRLLVGKDDLNNLIVMKKLQEFEPLIIKSAQDLKACVEIIIGFSNFISLEDEGEFSTLAFSPFAHKSEIDQTIKQYQLQFPEYPYGQHGDASCRLTWAMAPYLIDYNADYIGEKYTQELSTYLSLFQTTAELEKGAKITIIHGSANLRHFWINKTGCIEVLDHECISIGYVGYDLATLFYSAAEKNHLLTDQEYWNTMLRLVPQTYIEHSLLLAWLASYTLTELCIRAIKGSSIEEQITLLKFISIYLGRG